MSGTIRPSSSDPSWTPRTSATELSYSQRVRRRATIGLEAVVTQAAVEPPEGPPGPELAGAAVAPGPGPPAVINPLHPAADIPRVAIQRDTTRMILHAGRAAPRYRETVERRGPSLPRNTGGRTGHTYL